MRDLCRIIFPKGAFVQKSPCIFGLALLMHLENLHYHVTKSELQKNYKNFLENGKKQHHMDMISGSSANQPTQLMSKAVPDYPVGQGTVDYTY